ncbi:MAG: polyprenol phosphomannose-dependent alpha 1,6 mannosyltransferase MptB [Propionibacteriaceae bacterium]|nr:polyprenol phosphomannose-dependent alpha 1,6 mannosyltransferase MptB [Propionibacteriaceae bacterium]
MAPRTLPPLAALRRAWSHPAVRRGFFGSLAIEIGSFTPAYLPQASPIWGPLRALSLDGPVVKVLGTAIAMAGIWLLVDGWFRLRKTADRPAGPWPVLFLWCLPLLFGPPVFSHDAYSYAAQGWLVHNGVNPYQFGPGLIPGTFADLVAPVWRDTIAPYGPLALAMSHGLTDLSGFYATVAAELQRVPAVAGVVLIVTFLPRLAERVGADRGKVVWFACLNPLLVIDFVGGAHNDSLMMGLVVFALWLAVRGRAWWLPAALIVGAAAAIKQPAFLAALALPLLGRPSPLWREPKQALWAITKMVVALGLAVAAFAGLTWWIGLGFGWIHALGVPGSVPTASPTSLIGESIQWFADRSPSHAGVVGDRTYVVAVQTVGTITGFALIAVIAVWHGRRQPLRALSWSWLAIALLGPALHSWYVLWGVLLLPLTPGRRAVPRVAPAATVVLLSYAAINLAWRNGMVAVGIAAAALLLWLVVLHERDRHRAQSLDAESTG